LTCASRDVNILLLLCGNWNMDKVTDKFCNDYNNFFQQAGIEPLNILPPLESSCKEIECEICASTVPIEKAFALKCNHRFSDFFFFFFFFILIHLTS
jgi:hypothetical protein